MSPNTTPPCATTKCWAWKLRVVVVSTPLCSLLRLTGSFTCTQQVLSKGGSEGGWLTLAVEGSGGEEEPLF